MLARTARPLAIVFFLLLSILSLSARGGAEVPGTDERLPTVTTLEVFLVNGDEMDVVHEAFVRKHPDVAIRYDSVGSQQYEAILETMLAAGDPPDIMTVWPGARTATPAASGRLMDLTATEASDAIVPEYSARFSYKGRIYAICESVGPEGLYYNKAFLQRLGAAVPRDWPSLLDFSESVQAIGARPFSAGFREDWLIQRYTNAAFATLGYGRDPHFEEKLIAGQADFGFIGWVETFERIRTLVAAGHLGDSFLSTDNAEACTALAEGDAAMAVLTSGTYANRLSKIARTDFGLTAFPVNEKGQTLYGCWKPGTGLAVSSQTDYRQAAEAYLANFVDTEVHGRYAVRAGSYPVVRHVDDTMVKAPTIEFVERFVRPGLVYPGAHYQWPAGMSNDWKIKLQEFVGGAINTEHMIEWLNTEYGRRPNVYR